MKTILIAAVAGLTLIASAQADETTLTVQAVSPQGVGKAIGKVRFVDTAAGMTILPALKGLPAGWHGLHVHQNPDCTAREQDGKPVAALAAGGHYDPADTKAHQGPHAVGHLGDLPALYVDAKGSADQIALAPRLKVADLKGRSLIVHAGADNYADQPLPLGGGGARIACGVFGAK